MEDKARATEFEAIRHDLKNVLSALRSGCTLVEAELVGDAHETARAFLTEMRASIQIGSSLVDRLRRSEVDTSLDSDGSIREVGQ